MNRIILMAFSLLCLSSCTENMRTENFGNKMEIKLNKGYKVNYATWKDGDLWYFTEECDSSYKPKKKIFKEHSNYGFANGCVVFIEQ